MRKLLLLLLLLTSCASPCPTVEESDSNDPPTLYELVPFPKSEFVHTQHTMGSDRTSPYRV